jgi:hypothetical protein
MLESDFYRLTWGSTFRVRLEYSLKGNGPHVAREIPAKVSDPYTRQ